MGVFNRLGYNFDSTKFGSGEAFTAGEAKLLNSASSLKTWQADDLINVSATGYFQNPHTANLASLTILAGALFTNSNTGNITFTYAGSSANNLNLAANNVLLEIPSFTDHTNRISGVTTSSNPLTLPDYQIAMSIGRQVLSITNQIDGMQNNTPLLGNFTSLAIGGDISNTITLLTNDLATLNNSISMVGGNLVSNITSSSMNTIVADVQSAYTLLNGRRTADTNFYLNSLSLISDYNKVSQFDRVGVNSSYLINTLNIGTDKLKTNLQSNTVIPSVVNSGTTSSQNSSSYSSSGSGLNVTGVIAGNYSNATLTIDNYGRILYAANGASGSSVIANTQITGVITSNQLANTGVTAGTYGNTTNIPSVTVNTQGQITSISNTAISYIGNQAQIFTSSGTFTVPAGVTAVKATVVGGGGGGGSAYSNGTAGGTTSFGSYVSATGGGAGVAGGISGSGSGGSGGSSSNGNINYNGVTGGTSPQNGGSSGYGGASGGPSSPPTMDFSAYTVQGFFGGVGATWTSTTSPGASATGYGNGGAGNGNNADRSGGSGGGGGTGIKWITGLTPGSTISVTIGAAGSSGGGAATAGICVVEW